MMRRVAGCLVGLVVLPTGVATAITGYLVEQRFGDGEWGRALGWAGATFGLGVVSLALSGIALNLLGKRVDKTEAVDPVSERG